MLENKNAGGQHRRRSYFVKSIQIFLANRSAVYLSGLPINLIHGGATAVTLVPAGKPLWEKLHRVQLKYGIMS